MGKKGDDSKDLRKEVEMTEHQATIEEVARQYDVNLQSGLSDAEVKKVKRAFNIKITHDRRLPFSPYVFAI